MDRTIILNIDINSVTGPFLHSILQKPAWQEEDLYPFVDQYIDLPNGKESGLHALVFNTFCQLSAVDSQYMTTFSTFIEKKLAGGTTLEEIGWYVWPFYSIQKDFGIDPWEVWVRRCRQRGYEAWISIRMNDAHDRDYEECMMDEYAYRAKWRDHAIGEQYGYYWKCLNYAHDEVRERMLGYIGEQLARYDMDGLELDFMREIYCFDYLNQPECHLIMTQFMRDVRALVRRAEQTRGHAITLSARLPCDLQHCLIWGFDVAAWVGENLIDHVTPTPRWSSADSDMPIAEWVSRFPGLRVSAGVETLLRFEDLHRSEDDSTPHLDADTVNGLTAFYLSQGAEGINLYNYFSFPPSVSTDSTHCNSLPLCYERTQDILSRCSDAETVYSTPRRHIVMYQDIVPEGQNRRKPLPCRVNGEAGLTVSTGPIPDGKTAALYIAFSEGSPETAEISVNGIPCTDFTVTEQAEITEYPTALIMQTGAGIPGGSVLWCTPVTITGTADVQQVSVRSQNAVITHLELRIF